jgi:hypothetical protein
MLLQIEQAKGKIKKFIKKKIKFRKYVLDDGSGNVIKNEDGVQEIDEESEDDESDYQDSS